MIKKIAVIIFFIFLVILLWILLFILLGNIGISSASFFISSVMCTIGLLLYLSLKIPVWKILLYIAMVPLIAALINFSGYCHETRSWLSEDELVRMQLEWINQPNTLKTYPSHLTIIPYKNIDEMVTANPDMIMRDRKDFRKIKGEYIRTDEGAHAPSIFSRLTGDRMVRISLAPKQNVIDHSDGKEKTVRLLYNLPLNNCGKQWLYD